jgi:hypothetical protein
MSNHTPGPWRASPHPETAEANARLIAAAPDMYEFIRQINREAGIVGNESLFYATNALIAKVRGE